MLCLCSLATTAAVKCPSGLIIVGIHTVVLLIDESRFLQLQIALTPKEILISPMLEK